VHEFEDLPSQNRSFALFAALLPGVVPSPTTESTSADAIFVNGQDDNNNSFYVDGADNDDDVIGARAGAQARTAIEAIQEFQVLTSQFDAEFGRTVGGVLNAITKSGGNAFRGSAFGYFQRSDWNDKSFFVKRAGLEQPFAKFNSLGFTLGGPFIKDKLHFFASYEDDVDQRGAIGIFAARPEQNFTATVDNKIKNALGKIDYQLNGSNHLAARYLRETSPQFNQIIGNVTLEGAREEADTDSSWIASVDSVFNDRALNTGRVSFTKEDVAFANPGFNNNGQSFAAQRALTPTLARPTITEGASGVAQARINRSTQVDETFSYFLPEWHGEHQLKAGVQWSKREEEFGDFGTANGQFNFNTDRVFNPNDVTTYPTAFFLLVKGGLTADIPAAKTTGLFVQDRWQATKTLTLDLGLRWDKENITHDNSDYAPRLGFSWDPFGKGTTVVRGGVGRFYDRFQLGFFGNFFLNSAALTQGFTVRTPLSPSGDPTRDQQLFFDLARANGITTLVGLRDFLARQVEGGASGFINPSPTVDNPDRKQAFVDTISLGGEHELRPGLAVSLDVVHSENKDTILAVDLNPNSTSQGGRPNISVLNGRVTTFGAITSYVNAGESTQDSVQFALNKRFNGHYGGRLAYTWSDSSGNYGNAGAGTASAYFQTRTRSGYNFDTGEFIGDPLNLNLNDPRNDGQPQNFMRRHNVVLSGSYLVPHTQFRNGGGLMLSGIYRYLSGDRTTFTVSNILLDNGNRAPAPAGTYSPAVSSDISIDDLHFDGKLFGAENPDFSRLDLSLRYSLPIIRGLSVTVLGEAYNITNEANFQTSGSTLLRRDPATGNLVPNTPAQFLVPNSVYEPGGRQYQLGLRVAF
jgi:outer membrane receptor protein involved in Fe transport